jgi:hypothetical protein
MAVIGMRKDRGRWQLDDHENEGAEHEVQLLQPQSICTPIIRAGTAREIGHVNIQI